MAESINSARRERPILFIGPMVKAILDGSKTQTRRVVKPQPTDADVFRVNTVEQRLDGRWAGYTTGLTMIGEPFTCPYGQPGDRLWVRETAWYDREIIPVLGYRRAFFDCTSEVRKENARGGESGYSNFTNNAEVLDLNESLVKRPSIHMPRWASRLTLEITEVRVERVQEISEADAIAEGVGRGVWPEDRSPGDEVENAENGYFPPRSYVAGFAHLWDSLNGKRGYGWDANPWVWVIGFKRRSQ